MAYRLEFRKKLGEALAFAQAKNYDITKEDVEMHFAGEELSNEQLDMVWEYLMSQKAAKPAEQVPLTAEEEAYFAEYMESLKDANDPMTNYLRQIAQLAKEMNHSDIFIGDMIQEGSVSLVMAMEEYAGQPNEEHQIMTAVRRGMEAVVEEQNEVKRRDQNMVQKVAQLDEKIKNLTEELGRKVSVEELAEEMGMTTEEIEDVLKLAGEDVPEE